jgi:hypothetical protein
MHYCIQCCALREFHFGSMVATGNSIEGIVDLNMINDSFIDLS